MNTIIDSKKIMFVNGARQNEPTKKEAYVIQSGYNEMYDPKRKSAKQMTHYPL